MPPRSNSTPASDLGNPAFSDNMKYAPERHYADEEMLSRIYNGMYTGDWMWDTQVSHPLLLNDSELTSIGSARYGLEAPCFLSSSLQMEHFSRRSAEDTQHILSI